MSFSQGSMSTEKNVNVIVREVWQHNLESEFGLIKQASRRYSLVSLDTEFPGLVVLPNLSKEIRDSLIPQQNYEWMKSNVEALKIIQLGLTLSDFSGNLPDLGSRRHAYVWQFNFRDFDVYSDPHNPDSIALLKRQGIDFARNKREGVDSRDFAALLRESGLASRLSGLTWLTFHGAYDLGFLVKLLIGKLPLPRDLDVFVGLMKHFFGVAVYDMKHVIRHLDGLYGGLEAVARTLGVDRVAGKSHQAGSDSLLTTQAFLKMYRLYFPQISRGEFNCMLYGLEVPRSVCY